MDLSGKSGRFCPCANHTICPLLAMWSRVLLVPTTSSEPGRDLHSADVQSIPACEVTERISFNYKKEIKAKDPRDS